MDVLTAQLIFFAIMTIGICVWCHSLVRAWQLGRDDDRDVDEFGQPTNAKSTSDRHTGSFLVRGEQETVSRAIAKSILQHGTAFEVTERTTDRVLARRTAMTQATPAGAHFSDVGFALESAGEGTVEVIYCVDYGKKRNRLRFAALAVIFGIGLPLIIGVGLLIWLVVIPNGMRSQVLQTLHIGHAIWPPFMLIRQHRAIAEHSRAFVSNLLTSVALNDGVEPVV